MIYIASRSKHLSVHGGGNLSSPSCIDVVKRCATFIKKHHTVTKRTRGTKAKQVHFGLTCSGEAGKHIEHWMYMLDGKILSRQELLQLPRATDRKSDWAKIKRVPFFYSRTNGKKLFDTYDKLKEVVFDWLEKAGSALQASCPERYQQMMDATKPLTVNGSTFELRLVPHLPFTNGTINYIECHPNEINKVTTAKHKDEKDYIKGASVTESFKDGTVRGGQLKVRVAKNNWVKVPVGSMAVGTLHNLLHKVNGANGDGLRGSFITQISKKNIELADAIRGSTNAEAVDNAQKVDDVLNWLIPMTGHEVEMALGKKAVSPYYEAKGGQDALRTALFLPGNALLYPSAIQSASVPNGFCCMYGCGYTGPRTREGWDAVALHEGQCRMRECAPVAESVERPMV